MEGSKKLAILILAHRNLEQLKRLIISLNHKDIDIFIHLDKKWELSPRQIEELERTNSNRVIVCDNRISGKLFDWSLVQAEMELIRKAKQIEGEKENYYHYYLLLSGQDYPIKSVDYILSFLRNSYPKPFIDCTSSNSKYFLKRKFMTIPFENKVLRYFLKKYKPSTINKTFQRLLKIPFYTVIFLIKKVKKVPSNKLITLSCKLYTGSQWWILPDLAINDIYKFYYHSDDNIVRILSKTFGPDESFFQIMVMRTDIAYLVDINDKYTNGQNCLTYAHFSDEGKPFTGHPYNISINEYNKIKILPHLFARKFDESFDIEILNRIDKEILNNNHISI